ncbi:MAG: cation diffusion facilitator family transporter, partial [Gammaproteobacteria bacterium]
QSNALKKAIGIAFLFMVIEVIGGWLANSLALITDALHLSTDVGSLLLALAVLSIMARPKNHKMSYGFQRAEILGALASSVFLLVLCGFLIYESILRFFNPPTVVGEIVFVIALLGLLANMWMMRILHPIQHDDLNAKAAYLHVLGDLLASIAVVISGLLIWVTGFSIFDPIITLLVSLLLCWSAIKIIRQSTHILMEATPEGINPAEIETSLATLPGLVEVHDLHVWTVSSKQVALSVHLVVSSSVNILKEAHRLIAEKYNIRYMTIQVEEVDKFESKYCYDVDKYKMKVDK